MKTAAGALIVVVLYTLHQDLWLWRETRPLVLGVLPIGLFYHAAYTVATSLLLLVLIRLLWPGHLESDDHQRGRAGRTSDSR